MISYHAVTCREIDNDWLYIQVHSDWLDIQVLNDWLDIQVPNDWLDIQVLDRYPGTKWLVRYPSTEWLVRYPGKQVRLGMTLDVDIGVEPHANKHIITNVNQYIMRSCMITEDGSLLGNNHYDGTWPCGDCWFCP